MFFTDFTFYCYVSAKLVAFPHLLLIVASDWFVDNRAQEADLFRFDAVDISQAITV